MRTMIGLMPGPDKPPNLLPMAGRKVSVLIFRPKMVLATTSALAPARSAACATVTISPALGDSLTHTGLSVVARMSLTTSWVCSACRAKLPPFETPVVRYLMLEEILDALGRQPDRIDHAALDLGGARRRITGAVLARDGFCHHGAKPVDVHHLGEIGGKATGARHDRVLQFDGADFDAHIYHPTASCISNTGPSMQTRRNSFLPLTSNVRTQT